MISLKELFSVRKKLVESIDDNLNSFRIMKSRCFTQVPKHELFELATWGLEYYIWKKLGTQYLRDMVQLTNKVQQVEHVEAKKDKPNKYHKKEKASYIEMEEIDQIFDVDYVEESDIIWQS